MSPTSTSSSAAPRLNTGRRVLRWTFFIHRWLGVAIALLMALWTLSGFVMMYVSYPETRAVERYAGLDPLDMTACCAAVKLPESQIDSASVEMLLGKPVLRLMTPNGPLVLPLQGGSSPTIAEAEAGQVAQAFMRNSFGTAPPVRVERVEVDQWSLQQQRFAPLYKATLSDARGTVLYISGLTGEVVQDTHRSERLWNWFGAVPHWLYFTPLRKDGALWSQVVIWTSLLGTFLTLTGLYVGVVLFKWRKRKSPFHGVPLWHHWSGLIFGLVTLTWVFSGFASMQPWGWLESEGPGAEEQAMAGRPLAWSDVEALYTGLAAHPQAGVVSAEVTVQDGRPYAILTRTGGSRDRASLPDLAPAPPSTAELAALAAAPGLPVASQGLITEGDAYHYGHHSTPALLPAYRVIYADAEATRLYLDPRTGELIDFVDSGSRSFRWWHSGLHRLDFSGLRERPVWDLVTLPLLAGVAVVCVLGGWMGWRRMTRKKPKRPLRTSS